MIDQSLLGSLGVILVAAAFIGVVARVAKMPTIVAYILAGLLIGPALGILARTENVDLISEAGIVLLLFLVGLELSFDKIRDLGRVALIAGTLQIALTAAGGFALGLALGFSATSAGFVAVTLTFSSTVVAVKLLEEKGILQSLPGRITVGVLLVQDFAVMIVLTFLAGIGTSSTPTLASIARGLAGSFLGIGVLAIAALLAARYILPPLFTWVSNLPEALFIWSLSWCFLFVSVAELLGMTPEIGAFLGGVSLAQLPHSENLRRQVRPLTNFFIAVFFVGLGLHMELDAVRALLLPVLVLSAAALVGKPVLVGWILRRQGYGAGTSVQAGVALGQISEFSFLAAAQGLELGLIDETMMSLIGLVGLVTMAASAYLILYTKNALALVNSILRGDVGQETESEAPEEPALEGHVIVVGINELGVRILNHLLDQGEQVLAIDTDRRKLAELSCETIVGNVEHESVLEEANLARAKLLVSALQIEDTNNLLAYRCRELGVPTSIHAFDRSVVEELRNIGVNHLMLSKNVGIRQIAVRLQQEGLLPQ